MYTSDQLLQIWTSVNYREDRYWAFMKSDGTWRHSDSQFSKTSTYNSFDQFEKAVKLLDARDIHVKKTVSGGREWVIDVDHDDSDQRKIRLKNAIAHVTFAEFFGSNCEKIMFSGNRGLHIWLNHHKFDMQASAQTRRYYYNSVLKKPIFLNFALLQKGSLGWCFRNALKVPWIERQIQQLYPHISLNNNKMLLKEFYPYVDKQVFESTKQIRAPYSFNTKGRQFNQPHILEWTVSLNMCVPTGSETTATAKTK
ncbi:ORF64 [Agrotis segetum granulovirus]|uniref:Lef-1 n=1 Tax=Agrotis segetum granulosis virus TaxID=10464 RepID=Q6QXP7_GVAS|nr:lef-1 [Agrotis segetum granulovirus]AAS82674.1 ORF64 [Agrotis segetum granulovirus]AHN92115.1 lef-1 [Agrotis segetum granulovirus]AKN63350.1 lef-1 [Agrotis segetum granulovirus]